jgi:hypothetical protein
LTEAPDNAPEGCVGCNPDEVQPLLDKHNIQVEAVPVPKAGWSDVVICQKCGQAWLLMPRESDDTKPVA